jgi:phenylalanyl-tRNA synthetase beta chain
MKISLDWIRDFLDIPEDAPALGERLTRVGLAVDGMDPRGSDTVFELDVTSNRGDCLSHLGVARELGASYDAPVRMPDAAVPESSAGEAGPVSISIADADLCHRYCGRFIRGVTIGPSPGWLVARLETVGIRPINNVADITNYVLMELGHPLHAFDADTLTGPEIIVRRARDGETIRTLDGEERKLDRSMLVIADAGRPVALAGIMGGLDTEISDTTTNVLLESAWFDPVSVRQTGRAVSLGTEASYRFERSADIEMAPVALNRTARLIAEIAGGTVGGSIDVYPTRPERAGLGLRRARLDQRLGAPVPDDDVVRILGRLGFNPRSNPDGWTTSVPSFRHDMEREEDLIEEIARQYGYDRFPSKIPAWSGQGRRLPWQKEEDTLRGVLEGLGYSEACTIAFSHPDLEAQYAPGITPTAIRNPLSEDEPVMRTSMVPSILRAIQWNLHRGLGDVALYEIAKVYPEDGEQRQFVMATTGTIRPQTVHGPAIDADFYSLRGEVENILERFAVDRTPSVDNLPAHYHPGRAVRLGTVAVLGELEPERARSLKLRQKVYVAEIQVEELYRPGLKNIAAVPIPKYPPIRRDLSLVLARKVRYSDVVRAIREAGIGELIETAPFDKLDQGPFPETCYSLAVSLVFQSSERTLTDEDVEGFVGQILGRLGAIGVELRR